MGTGLLLLLIAFAFGGKNGNGNGNGENDNGNGNGENDIWKANLEPDYSPGPVLRPIPVDPIPDDVDDDAAWLDSVDALIADEPTPGRFYAIQGGDNMSGIAARALGANNNGSNRLALIKCITRVPWNDALYVSDRHPQGWGTLYDVDGQNLSAAFLPRHAYAQQAMANRNMPPRNIDSTGAYTSGQTGYFGLLWIPTFAANANSVSCQPGQPPTWLMDGLS